MLAGFRFDLVAKGYKRSIPGIILGLPYMVLGTLLRDPQAKSFFFAYSFGFNAYVIARKPFNESSAGSHPSRQFPRGR